MAYPSDSDPNSGVSFGDQRRYEIDYIYSQQKQKADAADQAWQDSFATPAYTPIDSYSPAAPSTSSMSYPLSFPTSGSGSAQRRPRTSVGSWLVAIVVAFFLFLVLPGAVYELTGQPILGVLTFVVALASVFVAEKYFKTSRGQLVLSLSKSIFGGAILLFLPGMIAWGFLMIRTGAVITDARFGRAALVVAALSVIGSTLLHRIFNWPIGSEEQIAAAKQRAERAWRVINITVLAAAAGLAVLVGIIYLAK